MDVSKVYGVSAPGAPTPPAEPAAPADGKAPETSAPAVATEPSGEQVEQTPAGSATTSAADAIDRLLKSSGRPVSSAVRFTGAASASSAEGRTETASKRGLFARIKGAPDASSSKPTGIKSDDAKDVSSGETSDASATDTSTTQGDNPEPKSALVKMRHIAIAATVTVVVAVVAVVLGIVTSSTRTVETAAPATGGAHTDKSSGKGGPQRDQPLPIKVVPPRCPAPSTDAANAVSGDPKKAWTCTRGFNSDGTQLSMNLEDGPYRLSQVCLVPGFDGSDGDNSDLWFKYRVVTQVTWRFDNGHPSGKPIEQTFDGSRKQQCQDIPGVLASTVTLTIRKTEMAAASNSSTPQKTPTELPGGFGSINLPMPGAGSNPAATTPADVNAFAVSSLQIFGHAPQ